MTQKDLDYYLDKALEVDEESNTEEDSEPIEELSTKGLVDLQKTDADPNSTL